jgi:acetyl esterase/lipase
MLLAIAVPVPETLNDHVSVYRNLQFVAHSNEALHLDLYVPRNVSEPVPAIVVIPGGGFRPQAKEKFAAEAQRLAEAGFAAASIGYRGVPENCYPDAVQDSKAAVRFVRGNAKHFNIDPEQIGAFGQSAGAYLAAMLAVSGGIEELEGGGGNDGVSSRVQAAVSFCGVFDFISRLRDGGHQQNLERRRVSNAAWVGEPFSADSATWKHASPYNHISVDDAPMLLVHCKDDATVPYQQSVQMYDGMKRVRLESSLLLYEKGGHGIRNSPLVGEEAWSTTIAFFRENLDRKESSTKPPKPKAVFHP